VETAFVELELHLGEMIAERRADQITKAQRGEEEEDDLFAMLVRATMEDEEKIAVGPEVSGEDDDEVRVKFGKQEVLGNTCEYCLERWRTRWVGVKHTGKHTGRVQGVLTVLSSDFLNAVMLLL
jgi:hypothetical protein